MSYRHLTITEGIKIETYLELRPCNDTCFAQVAQTHYEKLTKQKGRKSSWAPELK